MSAAQLLDACRAAGLSLVLDGEDVFVEGSDPAADLIAELRKHKQELIAALTPQVDIADDLDERAAIIEEGAGVPRRWAEGYAALSTMPAPAGFSPERWQRIVDAAGTFIDRWAAKAIACGWSDLDVFGCDDAAPDQRLDCMGLIMLVDHFEVIAIDEHGADVVAVRTGVKQRHYRKPLPAHTVRLWDLVRRA
jgi:hypothetical protein